MHQLSGHLMLYTVEQIGEVEKVQKGQQNWFMIVKDYHSQIV